MNERALRTLLQLQLARVPFAEAAKAVAEELGLDLPSGRGPAETLASLAPQAVDALRRAEREGTVLDVLRDLVDWTPGAVPPAGTLARDLYAVFSELAIASGEGVALGPAFERAARLPVRPGLVDALRATAAAEVLADGLASHPEFFAPSVVALLRRVEQAGDLHSAFLVLADGVMSGGFVPTAE